MTADGHVNGAGATVKRCAATIASVLDQWVQDGPLVHEPTGLPRLDDLTGGGPVYGSRWYVLGAPDAGKTALLVQLCSEWAGRGVTVGLLAVDEEPSDIVTRLAQRYGYQRHHCEARDLTVITKMGGELASLPINLYDASWCIEDAAADVARIASERAAAASKATPGKSQAPRGALLVDSLQTVRCRAEMLAEREMSETAAVTARALAIREVATRHRLILVTTSEMVRAAYRTTDPSQQTSALAAGKWSGSVEYSARVLLGLRSVSGESDLIECEVAKNKHGPRTTDATEHLYLRLDRRTQMLTQAGYEPPPAASKADRAASNVARAQTDAVDVARILLATPGLDVTGLRDAVLAKTGAGKDRVGAALATLGAAVITTPGPRKAKCMQIEPSALPAEVATALGVARVNP